MPPFAKLLWTPVIKSNPPFVWVTVYQHLAMANAELTTLGSAFSGNSLQWQ